MSELEAEVRRLPLVRYTNYLGQKLLIGADEQVIGEDEVPNVVAALDQRPGHPGEIKLEPWWRFW